MTAPQDYCREIEAYLCRKNDGHLIRIVGPAFEQVSRWAREGIPLKIACAGIDRYFERYYRKGPRRRPVRIEFCEADVRDVFDDWRRAVGVAGVAERDAGQEHDDTEAPGARRRSSLAAHIERAITRLATLGGSTPAAPALAPTLESTLQRLDALLPDARRARGEARARLTSELEGLDRHLIDAAIVALSGSERDRLAADAQRELEPFRARMLPESFARAQASAFERAVRERIGLPSLRYD